LKAVDLNHEVLGSGDLPLVVLHGLFGAGRNWRALAKKLSEQCRVYLLDMRNHGHSPQSEFMDYPHMAADVAAFLQCQGLERANILSHSMGGKAAMWLCLTQPDNIERIAVVDIAPVAYQHNFNIIVDALLRLPLAEINKRQQADSLLSVDIQEQGLRQFLLQNLESVQDGFRWRIDLDIIKAALPNILGFPSLDNISPYQNKALFLRGGKSKYLLDEHKHDIGALFPKVQYQTIAGAGHWPHVDQPDLFLDTVKQFFCINL